MKRNPALPVVGVASNLAGQAGAEAISNSAVPAVAIKVGAASAVNDRAVEDSVPVADKAVPLRIHWALPLIPTTTER